ncbi:putative bifunctional diguanylate cyclase/phosphodiesterase [Arenimonas sp. MALMAid1274]|uniref:putative bifunctional diguanylate cyclase/phosphodiesterase n=1 Tax=Arenimonas sp. MALMAid1274 TaxID=3411630 RepID=UPI003B9E05D2
MNAGSYANAGTALMATLGPHLQASTASGRPLGLLMLGLQGLRQFNIQNGYGNGERLVAKVQAMVQAALRPGDLVFQIGPADFAVLLPVIPDGKHAVLAASRLLRQFEQTLEVNGRPVLASVAVGIAVAPEHGLDADSLCRHAEASLALALGAADRMAMAPAQVFDTGIEPADLREAIQAGHLGIHFQPLWDLRAGRVAGAEALARWQHPTRGAISPAVFVPMAESTGMIAELTRWSINASLQHAVDAREAGIRLPVSINLSAVAFAERGLVEHLVGALRLWGVPADDVVIEVTETAIIADLDKGARILDRLSAEGVRVSIDDFGVGNSSFAYLREFPATELKIDRSFVTGMLGNERSLQLVKAMIDFAHHLGIRVVAEGVEDTATLERLAELNCDHAQGYAIGRAQPAADFIAGLVAGH